MPIKTFLLKVVGVFLILRTQKDAIQTIKYAWVIKILDYQFYIAEVLKMKKLGLYWYTLVLNTVLIENSSLS